MCTGAILLYKIPKVVIGENKTFMGTRTAPIERSDRPRPPGPSCIEMMATFIKTFPALWNEDIGV